MVYERGNGDEIIGFKNRRGVFNGRQKIRGGEKCNKQARREAFTGEVDETTTGGQKNGLGRMERTRRSKYRAGVL